MVSCVACGGDKEPTPTIMPTEGASEMPTETILPTQVPTSVPTKAPTQAPTQVPASPVTYDADALFAFGRLGWFAFNFCIFLPCFICFC